MSIRVHNADQFEELRQGAIRESSSPRSRSPLTTSTRHSFGGSPLGSDSPVTRTSLTSDLLRETHQKRMAMKHELYMKEQDARQKKLTDSIAENLQKQKTRKEAQYMKLWQDVDEGKMLAEELRAKLQLQDESRQRQSQRMYDEWSSEVFHRLNDPVHDKVQAMDSKALNQHRHEAYQRFLDITNKKGGLFRDIIIESEYNPLNDVKSLQYRANVDDPVKRVIRRREEEDRIASEGSTRRSTTQELGRTDNLDIQLWSQGVFESTPYGYFHKMMNSQPNADSSKTYASRVSFDHYNIEMGAEAVNRELPKGKRTNFDGYKIPKTTIALK